MSMNFRDNYATTCGVLAAGTTAGRFKTSQPVSHSINGIGYYKAATDDLQFTAGHTALTAGQRCAFFVALDAAGNVTTIQGDIVTPSPTGEVRRAAEIPNPVDKTVIGAVVVTSGGAAFTPGTTSLAGVATYYNFVGDYAVTLPL